MSLRGVVLALMTALASSAGAADGLLLPVFAHNAVGADGSRWSSELYLTNPGSVPVQVTLEQLLEGYVSAPAPCRSFLAATRVVPPRSAVVWTSASLSTDLGCVDEALGGLILSADGPLEVTSRIVRHEEPPTPGTHLTGVGQEIAAVPLHRVPGAGTYLLPALVWQRGRGRAPGFSAAVGFANPGPNPVSVLLQLATDAARHGLRVDDVAVELPYVLEVPPGAWMQVRLAPPNEDDGAPAGFSLLVTIDGPLAFYASVVDRSSDDPRTVVPVPLD
jgi:hypothetical protein